MLHTDKTTKESNNEEKQEQLIASAIKSISWLVILIQHAIPGPVLGTVGPNCKYFSGPISNPYLSLQKVNENETCE